MVSSNRKNSRLIQPASNRLQPIPPDALERGGMDRADNRHKRLFVAGWLLSDGTPEGDEFALKRALKLWQFREHELARPGRLTVAAIVAEVERLVA